MVHALINLDENTNRVLSIIKAKFGFRDKSEAIKFVVTEYVEMEEEPELKPEFIQKMGEIVRQRSIKIDDFAKHYGLKNS